MPPSPSTYLLKTSRARLDAYRRAARYAGLSLAEWIRRELDAAARYEPPTPSEAALRSSRSQRGRALREAEAMRPEMAAAYLAAAVGRSEIPEDLREILERRASLVDAT